MHSKEVIENYFDQIIERIEKGESLRKILPSLHLANSTFYKWCDNDPEKQKRYARACELRADAIFEDILDIADDSSQDSIETDRGEVLNSEFVQRSRLRVDARKWVVSKLNPKKYGDKLDIDHTTKGEKINVISLGSGIKPDESNS